MHGIGDGTPTLLLAVLSLLYTQYSIPRITSQPLERTCRLLGMGGHSPLHLYSCICKHAYVPMCLNSVALSLSLSLSLFLSLSLSLSTVSLSLVHSLSSSTAQGGVVLKAVGAAVAGLRR